MHGAVGGVGEAVGGDGVWWCSGLPGGEKTSDMAGMHCPRPEDSHWMELALAEARKGVGRTAPNPPVGAVVVKDGSLLGAGWHRAAGLPHAEREALAAAVRDQGAAGVVGTRVSLHRAHPALPRRDSYRCKRRP